MRPSEFGSGGRGRPPEVPTPFGPEGRSGRANRILVTSRARTLTVPRERPVPRERVLLQEECGTESNPCDDYDPIYNYCADYPNDPDCQEDEPGDPGPPPDDDPCDPRWDDCGGGSDPGDGDDEACDPAEETCDLCGDERDVIIGEYEDFPVNLSPDCDDFANSGGTATFSWPELNGRGPASTPPYGNLHWGQGQWGIVRASLTTRLEATRAHYGKPMAITGGYQCPHGNQGLPGADANSAHMHGTAADFQSLAADWDWDECQDLRLSVSAYTSIVSLCSAYGGDATTQTPGTHLHAQW